MATIRNKKKLALLDKENCDEHPRSNMTQNSNVPRSQEDYITQVSEEIEGRDAKKLSQEFTRRKKPHSRRVSTSWWLSHEPANSGPLWNRSGDVSERIWHKPGNEWGRLPEWSPSWSRHLPQPDDAKLWPRRWPRQTLIIAFRACY